MPKYNTSSVVESHGKNEANSTVQPVLDEISDEGEPDYIQPCSKSKAVRI